VGHRRPRGVRAEAQGFAWLDDLAAYGDTPEARRRAQAWTWDWIARFGAGQGAGLVTRSDRAADHPLGASRDLPVCPGATRPQTEAFYRALAAQAVFLSHRWKAARPGLPRFEALTGLVYAGLSLIGMEGLVPRRRRAGRPARREIDDEGGIPTRNPEELLEVLTLLTWAAGAMTDARRAVPPEPVSPRLPALRRRLRALRHADGGWRGFMAAGGGRGAAGSGAGGGGGQARPDARHGDGLCAACRGGARP
jgi:uncharacterized heparinase superfamily protein